MKTIVFSKELKDLRMPMTLGVLIANVKVAPSCDSIREQLNATAVHVEKMTLDNYKNETLEASRKIYRALKKDPSRYRISSDSLYRRLIKKKGLYYVNNVVDINNMISLKTLWSVGAYDMDNISGDIVYGVGSNQVYEGIGRGVLNIENLPVLIDDIGPFGSATSDSLRTMVTEKTCRVMMIIHGFGSSKGIEEALDEMETCLMMHAAGENIEKRLISLE